MLVGFGISKPVQWKFSIDRDESITHFIWLWFELFFAPIDLAHLTIESHIEFIKEDIDKNDGAVTYTRVGGGSGIGPF